MTIHINSITLLKPLVAADAENLFSLTDQHRDYLKQWLPWLDMTQDVSDTCKYIETAIEDQKKFKSYIYGIWHENVLAGVISLQNINMLNRSANIGYWVAENFSGRGLGKLATRNLVAHTFTNLKLNRIEIRCATGNLRSQNIPVKLGFSFEGVSKQAEWLYNHFVDHKVYSLLQKDWCEMDWSVF